MGGDQSYKTISVDFFAAIQDLKADDTAGLITAMEKAKEKHLITTLAYQNLCTALEDSVLLASQGSLEIASARTQLLMALGHFCAVASTYMRDVKNPKEMNETDFDEYNKIVGAVLNAAESYPRQHDLTEKPAVIDCTPG